MKISKASWMILAIGVFIIVLAGLGIARSGQLKEQAQVNQDLSMASARLGNIQVTQLQTQFDELQEQLSETQDQSDEAKDRLKQKIVSVDITDKFYEIANFYNVTVDDISTTPVAQQPYAGINCDTISLDANASGGHDDIVNFITGLNDNFTTGFVRTIQLSNSDNESSQVNVQMVVYSYKGS